MNHRFVFISHPNVVVDALTPVTEWPLSERGRERMSHGLRQRWVSGITSIYCSSERKAIDGAQILAEHLSLPFTRVEALGENDRSSTGFLPPTEFEVVADKFFANAETSIRGWERAVDAQLRIVEAVRRIDEEEQRTGTIGLVSHGAVGTLLYCWLTSCPISRQWDQPPNGGGNFYEFELQPRQAYGHWKAIDAGVV